MKNKNFSSSKSFILQIMLINVINNGEAPTI